VYNYHYSKFHHPKNQPSVTWATGGGVVATVKRLRGNILVIHPKTVSKRTVSEQPGN
jgi:hypothetical protein